MDATEKVEELMQDEEFIGLYDKEERDMLDYYAGMAYSKKLGREQGREEGQETERKNVIRNMVKHNMHISEIASIMNLNQSEVTKYLQI